MTRSRWALAFFLAVNASLPLSALVACTGDDPGAATDEPSDSSATATSATPEGDVAPIDAVAQILQGIYEDNPYPTTGAVVVLRIGDERRVITAGVSDAADQATFEETTRAPVASITKMMVAALTMRLVAAGRLDLRDTVEEHLPGVMPEGEAITVGALLSHRSGLPDQGGLKAGETWTPATLRRAMVGVRLESRPGSETFYSNLNYWTLALILEAVTGRRLGDLLGDQIFRPLGMEGSTLGRAIPPGVHAHGYVDGKDVTLENRDWGWAAGGAVSTAGDVDRFLVALHTGRVLPPAVIKTMVKPRGELPGDQGGGEYGLGIWHTAFIRCGDAWGHSGREPGFATEAYVLADGTRSVVVIVNGGISREDGGPGSSLSLGLLDAALCTQP